MKPNFEQMSTPELRTYVLSHRDDIEALRILMSRRNPPDSEATWYTLEQTEEAIKQRINRKN